MGCLAGLAPIVFNFVVVVVVVAANRQQISSEERIQILCGQPTVLSQNRS